MMRIKGMGEGLNELEERARRQDCELEIMRKVLEPIVKMNSTALIIA
jgi:hypothetical protein